MATNRQRLRRSPSAVLFDRLGPQRLDAPNQLVEFCIRLVAAPCRAACAAQALPYRVETSRVPAGRSPATMAVSTASCIIGRRSEPEPAMARRANVSIWIYAIAA